MFVAFQRWVHIRGAVASHVDCVKMLISSLKEMFCSKSVLSKVEIEPG